MDLGLQVIIVHLCYMICTMCIRCMRVSGDMNVHTYNYLNLNHFMLTNLENLFGERKRNHFRGSFFSLSPYFSGVRK